MKNDDNLVALSISFDDQVGEFKVTSRAVVLPPGVKVEKNRHGAVVPILFPEGDHGPGLSEDQVAGKAPADWEDIQGMEIIQAEEGELAEALYCPDCAALGIGGHGWLEQARKFEPLPHSGLGNPKVGRNAPCPCGSGRKYKKCCYC